MEDRVGGGRLSRKEGGGGPRLTSPVQTPGGVSQMLQRAPGPVQGWRGSGQGEMLAGGLGALRLVDERGQGGPSQGKRRKGLGARHPQSCPYLASWGRTDTDTVGTDGIS